jgi:RNA polymerase sigma-70 factor, ECF subfamily
MQSDSDLIDAARQGDLASFEALIVKFQPKVFGAARRYARTESDVEDIVQEVFIKAYQKLASYQAKAPFEHWLMRLTVHCCYDYLRNARRNREVVISDLTTEESEWMERFMAAPEAADENAEAARELISGVLAKLPPASRLVITLLELEERSVKEISELTGWSVPLVKVRAFRARLQMRRHVEALLAHKKM